MSVEAKKCKNTVADVEVNSRIRGALLLLVLAFVVAAIIGIFNGKMMSLFMVIIIMI